MPPIDSSSFEAPMTPLKAIKRSPTDSPEHTTPPSKKSKTTPMKSPGGNKGGDWTPEMRLKLFEAYQTVAAVRWDDVAAHMDAGVTGKQCREQWQRATGAKIKKALGEK